MVHNLFVWPGSAVDDHQFEAVLQITLPYHDQPNPCHIFNSDARAFSDSSGVLIMRIFFCQIEGIVVGIPMIHGF